MNLQQACIVAIVCLATATLSLPACTAEPVAQAEAVHAVKAGAATASANVRPDDKTIWVYPVIPKFGAVHPRPDAAVQPDPGADYRIFVDVVSTPKDMGEMFPSLDRLARLVNLMGFAKVPADHVHIVALLDEKAAYAALDNAHYRKYFKKDNPNLEVLRALHKAGVEMLICSQALAAHGLQDGDIDPSVTVSLSALTDPVVYGHAGYTFMRL